MKPEQQEDSKQEKQQTRKRSLEDERNSNTSKRQCVVEPSSPGIRESSNRPEDQLWSTAELKPGDKVYVKWFIEEQEEEVEEEDASLQKRHRGESSMILTKHRNNNNHYDSNSDFDSRTRRRSVVWWHGELSTSPVHRDVNSPERLQSETAGPNPSTSSEFESDDEGRFIWVVHYEPFGAFQAEDCRCVFLDRSSILHPDYDSSQALQFSLSPPENADEESVSTAEPDNSVDEEDNTTITLQEIIDAQKLIDAEEGDSRYPNLESFMDCAFNSLPHEMKIELALKYREFADNCESFLRQLIQEKGPNHVVTVQEIKDFFRDQKSCHPEKQ